MRKKIKYSIGDIFLIPLRKNGYAAGVIVKMDKGGVVLGYFFNKYFKNKNDIQHYNFSGTKIIFKCMFGDLGLIEGTWELIKKTADFEILKIPIKGFYRNPDDDNLFYITQYDQDFNIIFETKKLNLIIDDFYIKDSLLGSGAVEIIMTDKCKPD